MFLSRLQESKTVVVRKFHSKAVLQRRQIEGRVVGGGNPFSKLLHFTEPSRFPESFSFSAVNWRRVWATGRAVPQFVVLQEGKGQDTPFQMRLQPTGDLLMEGLAIHLQGWICVNLSRYRQARFSSFT